MRNVNYFSLSEMGASAEIIDAIRDCEITDSKRDYLASYEPLSTFNSTLDE